MSDVRLDVLCEVHSSFLRTCALLNEMCETEINYHLVFKQISFCVLKSVVKEMKQQVCLTFWCRNYFFLNFSTSCI